MPYSNDPHEDFRRHDTACARKLDACPVCEDCEQPITEARAFYRHGVWLCTECVKDCLTDVESVDE